MKSKGPVLAVFLAAAVLALAIFGFRAGNGFWAKKQAVNQATPSVSISGWKTYESPDGKFSFEYPNSFTVINSSDNQVQLGKGSNFAYLTISTNIKNADYRNYKACFETKDISSDKPCLYKGNDWGQPQDVYAMELSGKSAKSFYIAEALTHGDYHIVLTEGMPYIEAKMFVSGGGLDDNFAKILSTFKLQD